MLLISSRRLWFELALVLVHFIHVSLRMYSGGIGFYLSRAGSFVYFVSIVAMLLDIVISIIFERRMLVREQECLISWKL